MKSFNLLLKEFDLILTKYNTINYRKLKDSLPNDEVLSYLNKLKVIDSNFKSLYNWKNGNDVNDIAVMRCQIFNFGSMISLNSISFFMNTSELYWGPFFIPLVANGDGDYLLYNNENESDHGKLHLFSPSLLFIEEPITYYDSISSLLETTIEAYKQSALIYDSKEDWLDIDIDKYYEIAKQINIKSKYWALIK